MKTLFNIIMILLTGGLWIVWLLIRAANKKDGRVNYGQAILDMLLTLITAGLWGIVVLIRFLGK